MPPLLSISRGKYHWVNRASCIRRSKYSGSMSSEVIGDDPPSARSIGRTCALRAGPEPDSRFAGRLLVSITGGLVLLLELSGWHSRGLAEGVVYGAAAWLAVFQPGWLIPRAPGLSSESAWERPSGHCGGESHVQPTGCGDGASSVANPRSASDGGAHGYLPNTREQLPGVPFMRAGTRYIARYTRQLRHT